MPPPPPPPAPLAKLAQPLEQAIAFSAKDVKKKSSAVTKEAKSIFDADNEGLYDNEKSFESALPPPPVPGALFSLGKIKKGKGTKGADLNRRRMKPARSSHFCMAAPEIPAMRSMDLFAPNVSSLFGSSSKFSGEERRISGNPTTNMFRSIISMLPDDYERRPWIDQRFVNWQGLNLGDKDIVMIVEKQQKNGSWNVDDLFEAKYKKMLLQVLKNAGITSLGVIHEADIVALLVSVILYVVLMAVLDATKMSEVNNLWEDIMSWKKTASQKHPRLLQALANVRSFIRILGRRFPSLHYRLELGSDLGEAAVRMLKQSYGMSVSHRIELAGRS